MTAAVTSNVLKAIEAEARAVTEGHHARFDADRGVYLVKSDSGPRTYEVSVSTIFGATPELAVIRFSCTCPAGTRGRGDKPVPCKHAALVARRLEREGWATWDGQATPWRPAGALAAACEARRPSADSDPFDGLR